MVGLFGQCTLRHGVQRQFLSEWEREQFEQSGYAHVEHQVRIHNADVGREIIKQNMRRHCRCHGVSGSCEFKTCWIGVPDFEDIGKELKNRYDSEILTVQVAKRANKQALRRKRKAERRIPITNQELTYVNKSPSYCEPNDALGIIGTRGRQCNATTSQYTADSCTQLCCGRGYNTRVEHRTEQCHCKFVYCCYVKCKTCHVTEEVHTCK